MRYIKTFEQFQEDKLDESSIYFEGDQLVVESLNETLIYENLDQSFFNSLFAYNDVYHTVSHTKKTGFIFPDSTTTTTTIKSQELGLSPKGNLVFTGVLATILAGIIGYKYIESKRQVEKQLKSVKDSMRKKELEKELEEIKKREEDELEKAKIDGIRAKEEYDKKMSKMSDSEKDKFLEKSAKAGKKIASGAKKILQKFKNLFK